MVQYGHRLPLSSLPVRVLRVESARTGAEARSMSERYHASPASPPSAPDGEAAPRRLILADDSPTSLALLRAYLERVGWLVDGMSDGLSALRAAKARPPAAIVTDGLMPGMDGFLLCRAVRADPDLSGVPVVIYTSVYDADEDIYLARTAGATALLPKSSDPTPLLATLEAIMAGQMERAPLPRVDDLNFAREHLDRLVAILINQQVALDQALAMERAHTRALADLDRLRGSLINAVSHELRTPLTVVRGHASLLQRARNPLGPEQSHRHGQAILDACNRLTALLEDMLLVAQLEGDESPLQTSPVALLTSMTTARLAVQGRYSSSPCPVEVSCPDDLWVQANMRYLTHTLTHLLDNAVKHSPEGVSVEVSAHVEYPSGVVLISVRDHGPGLPPGDVERLFQKFSKGADDMMRAARVGVGIGLYLSRALVQRMGGEVGAHNASDGGAEFWVRLPGVVGV